MSIETEENLLEMLEISKLLDYNFFIPSCQMEHRLSKKRVKEKQKSKIGYDSKFING